MIAVRIPKEIRAYKEKIAFGLNFRQLLAVIIAIVICVPLYVIGKNYIHEEILSWAVLLISCPIVCFGFVNYNGMPFEKFIVAFLKQQLIYPGRRIYKTSCCYREWIDKYDVLYDTGNKRVKKKRDYLKSIERAYYLKEAKESGGSVDASKISNFLTVSTGSLRSMPEYEKNKKAEKEKQKSIVERIVSDKAKKIREKQAADPYYRVNRAERKVLIQWSIQESRRREKEVQSETKEVKKTHKKLSKRRKVTSSVPKTTQDTIPFVADYDYGIIEVEPGFFSKTYRIVDINYLLATLEEQEGIFVKYGEFLNSFPEDMSISITIDNWHVNIKQQEEKILLRMKNDVNDRHREEFNNILRYQLHAGRNEIQKIKYITVTVGCDSPYEAMLRFDKVDDDVIGNLRRIGSNAIPLSTEERLAILHDKFRKGREGEFQIDFDWVKSSGISSKDYIAPASFDFKDRKHFMIEDEYYRCLYLTNIPVSLSDEFLNEITNVNFPLTTTLSIQPLAQDKALKMVNRQLTGMESNKIEAQKRASKGGFSMDTISHNLKQSLTQAETLLDDMLNKNQKMFFVTITVMVNGHTLEELEDNVKTIMSKARSVNCQFQRFDYEQEKAFKVTLPLGYSPKHLSVERALTTEAVSIFMIFANVELFQVGGFYYGLNQVSRNLILCDRKEMKTPSGFILGSSGSGKSFATKREILNVLLSDSESSIIIIDPENEYIEFGKAFGAAIILLSPESGVRINAMDMSMHYGIDDDDDISKLTLDVLKSKALKKKSEFMITLVEQMLSDKSKNVSAITPQQKSLIDRCVQKCYKRYLDSDFNVQFIPTLLDFQNALEHEINSSEYAKSIAEGMEYHTRGNMNIFAYHTNINYQESRFVIFCLRDLGDQIRPAAYSIIFDHLINRMISNFNLGVRTYCWCDEVHIMFDTYYSAYFLKQLYKRGRKFGLVITGCTQNVEEVLKSDMAKLMLGNSSFIMMLNQAPEDLKLLVPMLNISEAQTGYVSNASAGSGLLFAESVIVPFIDHFPKESYLYKLMSTNFNEDEEDKQKGNKKPAPFAENTKQLQLGDGSDKRFIESA